MALGYDWVNIANWSVSKGAATVTFWIDAKLNRQDFGGNYSVVDTRLNSTIVNSLSGSGYNFQLTGSGGIAGSGVWYFGNETILTGQYTVYHNDNGSAYSTVSAYAYNKYWGIDQWFSGGFDLPTIPRAATINSFTGNDVDGSFNVTYTKKSNSFTHKLRISIPSVKALETYNYNSGTPFVLSNDSKDYIYNYAKTNQLSAVILGAVIETWNGGSKIGESTELKNSCTLGAISKIFINNQFKRATPYIRVNGSWKRVIPYIRNNNQWKRSR